MDVQRGAGLDFLHHAALDLLPVPAFVSTVPDGAIVRWNQLAVDLCEREPRVGEPLGELLQRLLDGEAGRRPTAISIEPLLATGDGPVAALLVRCRRTPPRADGTDEERFRTLADNIPQLAWMADETGWIFWYNRRWFEYTGTTLEEMRGWGWHTVHHPDHVERVRERFRRCVATGAAWEDTFPLRGKDGTYRWFLSRAMPTRDAGGRITGWFGTSTDITEQRLAEEALRQADSQKDQFLALLGHELRNPLASILAAARIIEQRASPPSLQRASEVVARQAGHIREIVEDLLDVGRIKSGKLRLEKRRADINALLMQAVEACAPLVERRRHTVAVTPAAPPFEIEVDAARIVQVICNLIGNAAKYMTEGGRIEVSAALEADTAAIRVRDVGIGIPPEMLGRIFERFVQLDDADDRIDGGLGLGLWLVKSIVEMHGGRVEACSEGRGHGSEFVVRLPAVPR